MYRKYTAIILSIIFIFRTITPGFGLAPVSIASLNKKQTLLREMGIAGVPMSYFKNTADAAEIVQYLLNNLSFSRMLDNYSGKEETIQTIIEFKKGGILSQEFFITDEDVLSLFYSMLTDINLHIRAEATRIVAQLIAYNLINDAFIRNNDLISFLLRGLNDVSAHVIVAAVDALELLVEKEKINKTIIGKNNVTASLVSILTDRDDFSFSHAVNALIMLKERKLLQVKDVKLEGSISHIKTVIRSERDGEISSDEFEAVFLLYRHGFLTGAQLKIIIFSVVYDKEREFNFRTLPDMQKEFFGSVIREGKLPEFDIDAEDMISHVIQELKKGEYFINWGIDVMESLAKKKLLNEHNIQEITDVCIKGIASGKTVEYGHVLGILKKNNLIQKTVIKDNNVLPTLITCLSNGNYEFRANILLTLETLIENDFFQERDIKNTALVDDTMKNLAYPSTSEFAARVLVLLKDKKLISQDMRVSEQQITAIKKNLTHKEDLKVIYAADALIALLEKDFIDSAIVKNTRLYSYVCKKIKVKAEYITIRYAKIISLLIKKELIETISFDDILYFYSHIPALTQMENEKEYREKISSIIKSRLLLTGSPLKADMNIINFINGNFKKINISDPYAYMILIDRIHAFIQNNPKNISESISDFIEKTLSLNSRRYKDKDVINKSFNVLIKIALCASQDVARRACYHIEQNIKKDIKPDLIRFYIGLAAPILALRPGVINSIEFMVNVIKEKIRLESIQLTSGGNAQSEIATVTKNILQNSETIQLSKPPGRIPKRKNNVSFSSIPEIKKQEVSAFLKNCSVALVLGRTIVYKRGNGTYVALKFLKDDSKENPGTLVYESEIFDYLNTYKNELGLKGIYPKSVLLEGSRIARIKNLPGNDLERIFSQISLAKNEITLKKSREYYTVMAYETDSLDYFTYLSDNKLRKRDFEKSCQTVVHDLYALARFGLIHTAVIDMFHNVVQRGRTDRGRYLWMVDIIRSFVTRTGAGRLHAWTQAVQYPNIRKSGLADFAELYTLDELMKPDNDVSVHLTRFLGHRYGEKTKNFYMASYLGDYMLSLSLVIGKRYRDKNKLTKKLYRDENNNLNWENPETVQKLSKTMKQLFENAYMCFKKDTGNMYLNRIIDWDMMARQMAFFMARNPIYPFFFRDPSNSNYWTNPLYGESAFVSYGSPGDEGWCDDGVNPDLGPHNGPNPLTELIKGLYIYTAFMVADQNQKIRRKKHTVPAKKSLSNKNTAILLSAA